MKTINQVIKEGKKSLNDEVLAYDCDGSGCLHSRLWGYADDKPRRNNHILHLGKT